MGNSASNAQHFSHVPQPPPPPPPVAQSEGYHGWNPFHKHVPTSAEINQKLDKDIFSGDIKSTLNDFNEHPIETITKASELFSKAKEYIPIITSMFRGSTRKRFGKRRTRRKHSTHRKHRKHRKHRSHRRSKNTKRTKKTKRTKSRKMNRRSRKL
jgi:hypothetical protein